MGKKNKRKNISETSKSKNREEYSKNKKKKQSTEETQHSNDELKQSETLQLSSAPATKNFADSENADAKKAVKTNGIDEIDALFATKKEQHKEQRKQEAEENKRRDEQRKMIFQENTASSGGLDNLKKVKKIKLDHDKTDVRKIQKGEWANDGLGGVFDVEGFTGRKEAGTGYKIYKAHLFNKKGFGTTKDCPFDCDCCYI
mmetsp:Transcript_2778/g.3279  ORF Transcript_2778/g.3279 Transcript_2778/m.3279 type:complete len:201 (-) Transcript_2778:262-864(-)